ncbi:hypothetical protein F3K43_47665 [Streptomyces sp. LBUM 1476]|nr:hypothetical protein [Streptomyces sp. LBUM 1476]
MRGPRTSRSRRPSSRGDVVGLVAQDVSAATQLGDDARSRGNGGGGLAGTQLTRHPAEQALVVLGVLAVRVVLDPEVGEEVGQRVPAGESAGRELLDEVERLDLETGPTSRNSEFVTMR